MRQHLKVIPCARPPAAPRPARPPAAAPLAGPLAAPAAPILARAWGRTRAPGLAPAAAALAARAARAEHARGKVAAPRQHHHKHAGRGAQALQLRAQRGLARCLAAAPPRVPLHQAPPHAKAPAACRAVCVRACA